MKPERIKRLRKRLGESQAAFGKRLGVPQPTIWRWETVGLNTSLPHRLMAAELARLEAEVRQKRGSAHDEPVPAAPA
jgi:transcriptional regulator with XRE-family HTH domain